MNEEQIQAAREAFKRDPETACRAMLGCSAEEMFVTALRGCNQHAHKPGCPEENGGGMSMNDYDRRAKEMSDIISEMESEGDMSRERRAEINYAKQQLQELERRKITAAKVGKKNQLDSLVKKANASGEKISTNFVDRDGNITDKPENAWGVLISRADFKNKATSSATQGASPLWQMIKDAGFKANPDNAAIVNKATGRVAGTSKTRVIWDKDKVSVQVPL